MNAIMRMRHLGVGVLLGILFAVLPLQAELNDGIVALWRLNETEGTFADSRGENTGIAVGSPHGDGSNGRVGGALALDGVNDWMRVDSDFGNFNVSDSFSVSLWLNLDATPTAFNFYVGRQTAAPTVQGWRIGNDTDNRARVSVIFQQSSNSSWFYRITNTEPLQGTAGWIHLAFTYDGSGSNVGLQLYVNGTTPATITSGSGSVSDITTPGIELSIGARNVDGGGKVAGNIDIVGIWNRVLTSAEVAELYNSGAGTELLPKGTVVIIK